MNMRLGLLVLAVSFLIPQFVQGTETKGLQIILTADKAVYTPREPIKLTLRVVNGTSKPVRFSFRTAQRFDLIMLDTQGREVWRWSAGRIFAQALGEEILKPSGGELLYEAVARGEFPSGAYTVNGIVQALEGAMLTSITLTIQ